MQQLLPLTLVVGNQDQGASVVGSLSNRGQDGQIVAEGLQPMTQGRSLEGHSSVCDIDVGVKMQSRTGTVRARRGADTGQTDIGQQQLVDHVQVVP